MRIGVAPALLCAVLVGPASARAEAVEDALAATFRLTDGKSSSTGFLVTTEAEAGRPARTLLVTAAHALEQMAGAECTLVLRAYEADQSYARCESKVPLRQDGEPRWRRHPDVDLAVLPIDVPAGVAARPFTLAELADDESLRAGKLHVGQDVCIPCFPATLEASSAGWPVLRKGTIASPIDPVGPVKTIIVDYNTFGGDSGAPVVLCTGSEPIVVAVVVGMHRQTDKLSMAFEERTVHTPLGLAIAVPACFVRETLALLEAPDASAQ